MTVDTERLKNVLPGLLIVGLVSLAAAVVFEQYGFYGFLGRDDSIYIYSGQQMLRGIPPYVSMFDHKGPLAPMLAGAGVFAARLFSWDDVFGVRLLFFSLGSLAAGALFLLGRDLFKSRLIGLLSAALLVNFWAFGIYVPSGPQPKTPMLLFQVLAIWLTARRKWFWGGFFGCLAALTWQPMAIFPFLTLLLAIFQSQQNSGWLTRLLAPLAGIALPLASVLSYFLFNNALADLFEGAILFNISHLERPAGSFLKNLRGICNSIFAGFSTMAVPLVLGLLAFGLIYYWRWRKNDGRLFSDDPFAGALCSFPFLIALSLIDFQRYFDFYPLLPYASLGSAWLVSGSIDAIARKETLGLIWRNAAASMMLIGLLGLAFMNYHYTAPAGIGDLNRQRAWAEQLAQEYGQDIRIASIGVPQSLVFLHKTNPNRYVFISNGIDNLIDARTPGGFEGWLKEMERSDPDVILYGTSKGEWIPRLEEWLVEHYERARVGDWTVFVRPGEE